MKKSKGQSLVEYALILALVAIVVIAALRAVGERARGTMEGVGGNLPS
ncbi:MAG TPA: Flp family type IVb pilin [Candidatus Brocadiia bacterium]|nr:Flp family type IVb pilin [Candidatus Brocadiia bacterium]